MTNPDRPKIKRPARKLSLPELGSLLLAMVLFVAAGVGVILNSFGEALLTFGIGVVVAIVVILITFRVKRGGAA
jgi:hypothetical protein